jgi:hypothetical protein
MKWIENIHSVETFCISSATTRRVNRAVVLSSSIIFQLSKIKAHVKKKKTGPHPFSR